MSKEAPAIFLVALPFTDLSGQKVRPAMQLAHTHDDDMIVCFISSKRHHKNDIAIAPVEGNGLKVKSYIRTAKIATIDKSLIVAKLGHVDTSIHMKVRDQLSKLFGI